MRTLTRALCILIAVLAAHDLAHAERGVLWVKVLNLKNRPMRRIHIGTEGPGSSAITKDNGLGKIVLAPQTKPGTWVTLHLLTKNYEFISPYDRRVLVPPFENESENYVRIFLVTIGDHTALVSGMFAVQMAAKFNAKLTPKSNDEEITQKQREAVLADIAKGVGLAPDEIERAIREYAKRSVDPYERGVLAIFERKYTDATAQLSQSYEIRKATLKNAQAGMAEVAFPLGQSLYSQGRYTDAVAMFQEVIAIRIDDATSLDWLGLSLHGAGRYSEAESFYKRAVELSEKAVGKGHFDTIQIVNHLAMVYVRQSKYAEAEPLYKHVLETVEKLQGKEHPDTASTLNNLALLYNYQGKIAEAEPLYKRAIEIKEKALNKNDLSIAVSLNNLAMLYRRQFKYAEAEPLFKRALDIRKMALGEEHPDTAQSLNNLGENYRAQGKIAEAGPLLKRALEIREKVLGKDHSDIAQSLNNLAMFYRAILWTFFPGEAPIGSTT